MKKRKISLLLITVSLISAFASCGLSDATASDTTAADGNSAAVGEDTAPLVTDDLSEFDFDGYTFKMYIRGDDNFIPDMWAESTNGDVLNDAVFERNQAVADRFNVEFTMIRSPHSGGSDAKNTILAGDDAYDIIVCHARDAAGYAHQELVLNWNTDLPHIDLDKPYWNQDARRNLSICNVLYSCSGDICHLNLGAAVGIFYNKKILEELNINDIYDTVLDGKWTFDLFSRYAKQGTRDLNGDSAIDIKEDVLGYQTTHWLGPIQVLYSGGQRICGKSEKDELYLTLNTERTGDIFEKYFAFTDSDAGHIYLEEGHELDIQRAFAENRIMFIDPNIKDANNLRDMTSDFGIIPWPKFDESEEKYYSNVDAGCNLIVVPVTAGDPERTSVILEALCAKGSELVMPTYYETVLQTKFVRDDESVMMLDLIKDGRVFDPGYFYDDHGQFIDEFNSIGKYLAHEEDHSFAPFYAKYESKGKEKINELNEIFAGYLK